MDPTTMLDVRLLLVTGKGGVGKSSVAAALGLAGARSGRRTCLVEVEGRQTFSRLFGTQPWDFTEREFRPSLHGLSIDPEASLIEYLDMFYGAKRLSKLVVGSAAVEFATTAAPGVKDVLLIGKVKEMERRRDEDGRFHYDLIIVDAPPTGRIVNFLRAPDATTELVSVGPIRNQAQTLVDMLLDSARTNVVLVTLLEELPVTETIDGAQALRELGVALGPLVINRVLPERFDAETRRCLEEGVKPAEILEVLTAAGLEVDQDAAERLVDVGRQHLERLELQERMRHRLGERLDTASLELPELYDEEFSEREIGHLADLLLEVVA